jgi:hypothetical protein
MQKILIVDKRRLVLSEMQVDKSSFPVHTLELNNPNVLLRLEQVEGAKGRNVVIGDPRPMTPDGKPTLRITVNAPKLGGQGDSTSSFGWPVVQARLVRPVSPTSQTGPSNRSDRSRDQSRTFKPKHP